MLFIRPLQLRGRQGGLRREGRCDFPRMTRLLRGGARTQTQGSRPQFRGLTKVVRCLVAPSRWLGRSWTNPEQGDQLSGELKNQGFPRIWDFQH